MPIELKRCPKCGGYVVRLFLDYGVYFPDKIAYGVGCFNLDCEHTVGWFETPEEAEAAWNEEADDALD